MRRMRLLTTIVLAAFLMAAVPAPRTQAQAVMNGWSAPQNVSMSGETVSPLVTTDESGVTHAFWLNRRSGFFYAVNTMDGWSEPASVELPMEEDVLFNTNPVSDSFPILLSGLSNRLYLVWQRDGSLQFSIGVTSPGKPQVTWRQPDVLVTSSYSFDVVVDEDGIIHLVYVQPVEADGLPAGIYYVYSSSGGASWAARQLLYSSDYFSAILQERPDGTLLDNAVDLTVTSKVDQKSVYVVFDNQPRKQVFLSRSMDGGNHWEEAIEIDSPASGSLLASPGLIRVSAIGNKVLLSWQVKQSDTVCFTYFQSSTDSGSHWSSKQRLYTPYAGCPDQFDFIQDYTAYSLLISASNDLVYLNAWDGESWTGFQLQPILSTFVDPETFENITLSVSGWTVSNNERLSIIGFDTASSGDTWVTSRSLADIRSWFTSQPGWKSAYVMESNSEIVSDLHVISDGDEALHAFWVQKEIVTPQEGVLVQAEPSRVGYYSGYKENRWSDPVQIFRAYHFSSGLTTPNQVDGVLDLTVTTGPDDRLWAVWKSSLGGETYFSWVNASNAGSASEWSTPAVIATIPITAREFSVIVDETGAVNIAYVIPVNEGRGVYLVRSSDQGKTWSNDLQAFGAQGTAWELISKPSIAALGNIDLSVLFSNQSTGASNLAKGLYSLHSTDQGASWSAIETVSTEPILWNQMLTFSPSTFHRLWMEQVGSKGVSIFHQVSLDGGQSWGRVFRVSEGNTERGPISAVIDRAGQIHLAQMVEDNNNHIVLRYWIWDGRNWDFQDDYDLGSGRIDEKSLIGLGISPRGILGSVVSRSIVKMDPYRPESVMLALHRPVTVPALVNPAVPMVETPTAAPTIESSPVPEATPTIELAALKQVPPSSGGSTVTGLLLGAVASLLVIGSGAGYAALRHRRRE